MRGPLSFAISTIAFMLTPTRAAPQDRPSTPLLIFLLRLFYFTAFGLIPTGLVSYRRAGQVPHGNRRSPSRADARQRKRVSKKSLIDYETALLQSPRLVPTGAHIPTPLRVVVRGLLRGMLRGPGHPSAFSAAFYAMRQERVHCGPVRAGRENFCRAGIDDGVRWA